MLQDVAPFSGLVGGGDDGKRKSKTKQNADADAGDSGSSPNCHIIVKNLDSISAVGLIMGEGRNSTSSSVPPPAVLVFASDTNPGGSKTGTNQGTQEEAICRVSTLRPAQEGLSFPIPTLGVAYVPHVQAFLPDGPQQFGAICSALRMAVADGVSPSHKEKIFLESKIRSVLDCALNYGHRSIVLGAWGCGAFGNPPEIIAATLF